ncbi:MAG: type IX secretion system membrane protein PorP/SprF [Bacteroidota bacterium]
MKKITTLLAFCVSVLCLHAQDDPHYTHYMFNQLVINPAYAGSKDALHLMALYRNQWQGIDGAPKTINIHAHRPFFNDKAGIGLSLVGDQIGLTNTLYLDGSYAYRLKVSDKGKLAIGIKGRLEYARLDWTQADPITIIDEKIPGTSITRLSPNFGAGFYYSDDRFYLGASAPVLLKTTVYTDDPLSNTNIRSLRSYYLIAGMVMQLKKNVKFRPSVMFSYNPTAPLDMNFNASFIFLDALWVGAGYRLGDAIDAMVGYQFNPQWRAYFSVDFTTSKLRDKTYGSYEVMLEYTLQYDNKRLNNIRYF